MSKFEDIISRASSTIINISLIPVALLAILTFFTDGEASYIIKGLFSEKTSILSNSERDVMDEWVIILETTNSKSDAENQKDKFISDLKESQYECKKEDCLIAKIPDCRKSDHGCWQDNIHIVRHPSHKSSWMVALDTTNGVGSNPQTTDELEQVRESWEDKSGKTSLTYERDLLEKWFKDKKPYLYKNEIFSKTYGQIEDFKPKGE